MIGVSYDGEWRGFDSDGKLLANSCDGCIAVYLARLLYSLQRSGENGAEDTQQGRSTSLCKVGAASNQSNGYNPRSLGFSLCRRGRFRALRKTSSKWRSSVRISEIARNRRCARLEFASGAFIDGLTRNDR